MRTPPENDDALMNWIFVDMDGFFASVEKHLRPELRDHPVGVVPLKSEHTCVIASSTDAKKFGVKVGTMVPEARAKCPGIKLIPARPHVYVEVHNQVAACINQCLPIYKAKSIDEWAIRLMGAERIPERAVELGRRIKQTIYEQMSPWLGVSVGIASTQLLAKIASDLDKPDGFAMLSPNDLPGRLEHLGLKDLVGINTGMQARLNTHGVRTVLDLWNLSRREFIGVWGSVNGGEWWEGFHGIDEPEIPEQRRSMSHSHVLDPKLRTREGARSMLMRLTHRLGIRLRDADLVTSRVHLSVSASDHHARFHEYADIPETQSTIEIMRAVSELWERCRLGSQPKKVGVTVTGLVRRTEATGCLFENVDQGARLSRVIDTINKRWGLTAAYMGAMHGCAHSMQDKIAFGRIPAELPRGI